MDIIVLMYTKITLWFRVQKVNVSTGEKQSVMQTPADNFSYSLDPATWVGPIERYRVFHTDPLLLCCIQERCHAIIAIVWIWPDSTYPRPAEVFYQLGQCISLELITGDCPEETRVLLLIRQTCTRGKVAHLKKRIGLSVNSFVVQTENQHWNTTFGRNLLEGC